jgi:hypothetical protein
MDQCEIKHIMMLQIKTIRSVLKVSTNIFTSITARPIELAVILEIMWILTFIVAVILYIYIYIYIYRDCQTFCLRKMRTVILN